MAIYNIYDHTIGYGENMPVHRADVTLAANDSAGVYVLGVKYPGRAADAGLRELDIVLSVDRMPVADLASLASAYERTSGVAVAKRTVLVEVLRDGRRLFLAVEVAGTEKESR